MAEESDLDKTEPATPRRLEKAREEGQVARSRELNTFLLLSAGVAAIWFLGGHLYRDLAGIIQTTMWFDLRVMSDTSVMLRMAGQSALQALVTMAPVFATLVVVAILASVSLGGLLFSSKALAFKAERLSPLKGIKRMFSAQTMMELLKTLAKALCIALVAIWVIASHQDEMISLMGASPTQALIGGMRLVALCCGLIVASLLIIVLIDAPWQLYSHHKKLRMSRQDVKQEHKESEGDPHLKGHIRQQQRAMARRRMMASVPSADVVITNPTHYAVALRYEDGVSQAPRVVAKGAGLVAGKIMSLADQHRVPMLSAPPLARALYRHVELEHEIPMQLYSAVAEVLAWVYQLRAWSAGQGPQPSQPQDLAVPSALDPLASASGRDL